MKTLWQGLRSLVFIAALYLGMAVLGAAFLLPTLINRKVAHRAVKVFTGYVRWAARWIIGLKSEIRGTVPQGEVLIASKHQSFFDIILIVDSVPRPKFIMKKQILRTPIVGFYATSIGCIPVDRGKRGQAIRKMVADVKSGAAEPGQLIIFPQGTRVPAGERRPYKIGTGVLYNETGQPCVPAATNVGVFWPKHGIIRKPGVAVVEFLDPIAPGQEMHAFMDQVEEAVETRSDALMREAGFDPGS